jgi:hypothetical protein
MSAQSPILVGIDNDAKEMVDELKNIDERLREQNKTIANLKERSGGFKDKEYKAAWEEQVVNMEYIYKEDKALIGMMQEIKSLYLQKKKFMVGGGLCPPEIQSKLIDKVMDYKKEKMRVKEEIEDINDELQKILGLDSGEVMAEPRKRPQDEEPPRTKFMTQLNYMNPEKLKKKPKEFYDYLENYEAELSKSLMTTQAGSAEFRERMQELAKVSEMKSLFADSLRRKEMNLIKGYTPINYNNMKALDGHPGANLEGRQALLKREAEVGSMNDRDEELVRLQSKLAKMGETVRGLEELNKEKEKLALLQREKYEHLERERYEVEIQRLKAEREKEEAGHLRRLQKMGMELDYIEQLKSKTIGIVSEQIREFGKMEEDAWKQKRDRQRELHMEEMLKMQRQYARKDETREKALELQMKAVEQKYERAMQMIDSQQFDPDMLLLRQNKGLPPDVLARLKKAKSETDEPTEEDTELLDDVRYQKEVEKAKRKYLEKKQKLAE